MAQPQQVYMQYPSPVVMVNNTPTPVGYNYGQHPSMQPYYPSQVPVMQQPYVYQQPYVRRHNTCAECCCFDLLCLGACCACCCAEECCVGDGCCSNVDGTGGVYNDDCCGCY